MKKYLSGITTGAIVGAAFGMMILPQLDRRTQKTFRKVGRKVIDMAEDKVDIMGWMK
ncbi:MULTISPECIES: hypothetical protein [Clostridium]|uniref:YtxH domain-containing protein n=1 Tax=Clostridium paridis TaxID=2803863 RepID=A0A937FHL5_9CLOT|nr:MULTISPECIES: hypothetical protein [Clostridium]MBL4932432.1 hypothetical protein [Clostridium paridis]MDD7792937.1 hypothetical protein [Clostridium sp. 'White wine YQ']